MRIRIGFFVGLFLALSVLPVKAATYQVDADHSSVSFKIRHLLSNTRGQFNTFNGQIQYQEGAPETWAASGSIDVKSLDTNVQKRDQHLLSPDFFDAENYPSIEFKSSKVLESSATEAKLEGTLKMRGVEKPVILEVQILGVGKDPWGNTRAAFSARTKINRKDFGLDWNKAVETGQLLGEEVVIDLEIEAILQAA